MIPIAVRLQMWQLGIEEVPVHPWPQLSVTIWTLLPTGAPSSSINNPDLCLPQRFNQEQTWIIASQKWGHRNKVGVHASSIATGEKIWSYCFGWSCSLKPMTGTPSSNFWNVCSHKIDLCVLQKTWQLPRSMCIHFLTRIWPILNSNRRTLLSYS